MKNKFWMIFLSSSLIINSASADQTSNFESAVEISHTFDHIRLFDSFFGDAVRLKNPYAELDMELHGFENGSKSTYKLRAGVPITSNIDFGGSIGIVNRYSESSDDSDTDVSDLTFSVRYHFDNLNVFDFKPANVSAGMRFDIPTGGGEDSLEFEAFSAIRLPVNKKLVATGHLGLGYAEHTSIIVAGSSHNISGIFGATNNIGGTDISLVAVDDGGFSFFASTGVIYKIDPSIHITMELSGDTGNEAGFFTSGVDYEIIPNGRLRFGVGAGFGDRAPDYTVQGGFLYSFDDFGSIL